MSSKLLILWIVLPLAVLLGFFLSEPTSLNSFVMLGLVVGALLIPVFIRWHHPILLASFNSGLSIFFLPGQPPFWMVLTMVSLTFTMLACLLNKEQRFLHIPALTWTLLAFVLVVVVTAQATGGMGVRSLGGHVYGGKKYFFIIFAAMAYFAVSGLTIAPEKANRYVGFFLLSQVILASSNLIYLAGPDFYFLYLFFPVEHAINQATEDLMGNPIFTRLSGIGFAGVGVFLYLQMRYGIRGLLDLNKPWRLLFCLAVIFVSMLGGFRSVLAIFFLVAVVQYCFEGLFWSRMTVTLAVLGVGCAVVVAVFASRMPMSVQRSLSFLPVEVHPLARADAQASLNWRVSMWTILWDEIPTYFWKGKGYTATATDYYLAQESVRLGLARDIEVSLIAGDYHSGPLSILIPFGVFGLLTFCLLMYVSIRILYNNFRHGPPELRNVNLFLLSAFVARLLYFVILFGGISSDIVLFMGMLGLSVAVNGGERKAAQTAKVTEEVEAVPAAA